MEKDPRIDAYISKSAAFARPVLEHFRELVHKTCPGVTETMKWSFPHFDYKGIMCNMAAFKHHCAIGFWKAALMKDAALLTGAKEAMGHLGKITSVKDLPPDKILTGYIKEAMLLNETGVKTSRRKAPAKKQALEIPAVLQKALAKNKAAREVFEAFSYSNKKEYVEWINEAKTDKTREERLKTAVEWMSEGKVRNWKYQKK
jgi:uncharacterized protein YdeI (YjbR/CyaY-like superfamily)